MNDGRTQEEVIENVRGQEGGRYNGMWAYDTKELGFFNWKRNGLHVAAEQEGSTTTLAPGPGYVGYWREEP